MQTPEGYSLERTDEAFRASRGAAAARCRASPTCSPPSATPAAACAPGEGPVTSGGIYVRLSELEQRRLSQFDDDEEGARALLADFPDLRTSVQNVNLFLSGGQRYTEIEFDLTGPSLDEAGGLLRRDRQRHAADAGLRRRRHHAVRAPARAAACRSRARRPPTSASTCSDIAATLQHAGRRRAGQQVQGGPGAVRRLAARRAARPRRSARHRRPRDRRAGRQAGASWPTWPR